MTKFFCGPLSSLDEMPESARPIVLYDRPPSTTFASAGRSVARVTRRMSLDPDPAAWDLLSIALSVVVADAATKRNSSPDGWTREIDLEVSIRDPDRWLPHAEALSSALAFLTTDRWSIKFRGNATYNSPMNPKMSLASGVTLLSGGLDSLVGAIDLSSQGQGLFSVSQTVRGDAERQDRFATSISGIVDSLQINHNAAIGGGPKEPSQRSRSIAFLAFGVLAATTTERYRQGEVVPLYICENGFIAVNPPLTNARLGSLSTRTAHPEFLGRMQGIFDQVGLRVQIKNPYSVLTKGEMLARCLDQEILATEASGSTSCGRFQRFKYTHCGRCVPCQIRRSAFLAAEMEDATEYVYEDLGKRDHEHAGFDDVRSVVMARMTAAEDGADRWIGSSLSSPYISNRSELEAMLRRGLSELDQLHVQYGVV